MKDTDLTDVTLVNVRTADEVLLRPCVTETVKTDFEEKGKTFILFSDDLDKTLATFVLANGAATTSIG